MSQLQKEASYVDGFVTALNENGVSAEDFVKQASQTDDPQIRKIASAMVKLAELRSQQRQKEANIGRGLTDDVARAVGGMADEGVVSKMLQSARAAKDRGYNATTSGFGAMDEVARRLQQGEDVVSSGGFGRVDDIAERLGGGGGKGFSAGQLTSRVSGKPHTSGVPAAAGQLGGDFVGRGGQAEGLSNLQKALLGAGGAGLAGAGGYGAYQAMQPREPTLAGTLGLSDAPSYLR